MRLALLGVAAALAAGCSNKLGGDVTLDGEAFAPSSCRNGVVHGFRGVEVTGRSGARLRIAAAVTGEARVIVIPAGATSGADLGACGTLSIEDQKSTINDVRNVRGRAELACEGAHRVQGTVTFENCH